MTWKSCCVGLLLVLTVACGRDTSATDAANVRRGDEFMAKQQYDQAILAYRAALHPRSKAPLVRLKLAKAYKLVGQSKGVFDEAWYALQLLPDNREAALLAAPGFLQQGHWSDAVDRLTVILRDDPDNVDALINWANGTAHLVNSSSALRTLADLVGDSEKYAAALFTVRPTTTKANDAAAEDAFRKAVRLAPTSLEAEVALVNFLWASGHPEQGEEELKHLADDSPRGVIHALANHALGSFYLSHHRDADGERYLTRAGEPTIGGRGARLTLADHYIQAGSDADAMAFLESIKARDDDSGEISLRMAAVAFRSGKRDQAAQYLDALLKRDPHNPRAVLLKAQFLLARGETDQALKFAREAAAGNSRSSDARSTLGRILFASGDLENAFDELLEAARLQPGQAAPALELVRVSLALGRDKEALLYAREAARLKPDDKEAALAVVKALILAGDYSGAEEELKFARSPESPSADRLVQLGTAQAARGEDMAAQATFERALQLDHNSLDALSGIVSLALKGQRVAAARQRVDAALAVHPHDPGYLRLAATVYAAQHDNARTESTLQQAVTLDRANLRAALSLADILATERRFDDAKRVLDQLLERRPRAVAAQTSVAMVLERMGRTAEARSQYEKILVESPGSVTASRRLAALATRAE